jgi:hypothetical protein
MSDMSRRAFITLLGGAAALPLAVARSSASGCGASVYERLVAGGLPLMSDGYEKSEHYSRPPLSTMIWTAISLAIGLGTLLYWMIV